MSDLTEYSFDDVKAHDSKKDLWVVINNKVYDITSFVDEHPGGEEVLLDVAGQDSTEAFDDVGHSDEAREILEKLVKGRLRGTVPKPVKAANAHANAAASSSEGSLLMYILFFFGIAAAYGAYQYLQKQ